MPDANEVRALAARVEARDGAPPLSDQALTQLTSESVAHFATDGGYAQLADESLEIAAEPEAYVPLLDAAEAAGARTAWTHGTRSPLASILEERGYRRARILHRLELPSLDNLPDDRPLPDGVTVRAFVPGQDEDAWLAVNAAAFATHQEQGSWTRADLEARELESWFDPAGFLIAEGSLRPEHGYGRAYEMLGFHWTKVHDDGRGEVYVLGVAPAAQGLKLGAALLIRGLRRLQSRGCPAVLLYVDDDNTAAMRLYEKYGFVRADTDVRWRAP